MTLPTVLVTGASTGIGAVYADRFAHRGHDLVLVARDTDRLSTLAARLTAKTGVKVDILPADLTREEDLAAVEARLRDHAAIEILINNAGAGLGGSFVEQSAEAVQHNVSLNTTALIRLTHAIAPRLATLGRGAIVNLGSVVGLAPEFGMSVYGATKAFVLFLSQALNLELGTKGVYVQAVLPSATGTELWSRAGMVDADLSGMMDVGTLVDAALVGFDRREGVTVPPLHEGELWDAFDAARKAMVPRFAQVRPADRYIAA